MLEVQKRNGDIVPFDKEKIIDALTKKGYNPKLESPKNIYN